MAALHSTEGRRRRSHCGCRSAFYVPLSPFPKARIDASLMRPRAEKVGANAIEYVVRTGQSQWASRPRRRLQRRKSIRGGSTASIEKAEAKQPDGQATAAIHRQKKKRCLLRKVGRQESFLKRKDAAATATKKKKKKTTTTTTTTIFEAEGH